MSDELEARVARLDVWAADPVVFRVVHELAAANRWREALDRARSAIRFGAAKDRVLLSLAAGALDAGHSDRCLKALGQVSASAQTEGEGLGLHVRALLLAGDEARARRLLDHRRAAAPDDPVAQRLASSLAGAPGASGDLPLETTRRVEALLAAGQTGRALRLARRVRLDHPRDAALADLARRCAHQVDQLGARLDDVVAGRPLPELEAGA